jgi:hypothetical protein
MDRCGRGRGCRAAAACVGVIVGVACVIVAFVVVVVVVRGVVVTRVIATVIAVAMVVRAMSVIDALAFRGFPISVFMPGAPVGTGFDLFGTVCFGVVGVRHGGFLVRFVV